MEHTEKVIVRFPPSPTGALHIGNIRTLLFNYLFARKNNGKIIMRFEDTDRERSKKEFEDIALATLSELGLDFDEGPFRQSERTERYIEVLDSLLERGLAYEAEESKDGSGDKVIRFKNPNKNITFIDAVRGSITIDTTDFGDFVIARSKTNPLYHLTVVVDDIDMGITHIIRGEDHITSTPRQILLIEALGASVPEYAHLPLIIGEDKKKLGKRHGAVTWTEFKEQGILAEAFINYLALLGWNPGDEREIFTKSELVREFSIERINNSPARFSYEKLDSINKEHLRALSDKEFENTIALFIPQWIFKKISGNSQLKETLLFGEIRERISKGADIVTMDKNGDFDYLKDEISYAPEMLVWKKDAPKDAKRHLMYALSVFSELDERTFTKESIKKALWDYATEEGRGSVLWPLRTALSGAERSPDPFSLAEMLGKTRTLERVQNAIDAL